MSFQTTHLRTIYTLIGVCIFVVVAFIVTTKDNADHKNISYTIEGVSILLEDGTHESSTTTRYFGNELVTDLDGDGDEDIAFILTQEGSGSGTFYYAVAALQTDSGYVGSDGYFLGDRIAPQTTEVSPNPRHKHVVVFNYATRALHEPMTARPSIGESVYLKIVPKTIQWAVVVPNFEGESAF